MTRSLELETAVRNLESMLERRGWEGPPRLWTLRQGPRGIVAKPSEIPPSEWTRHQTEDGAGHPVQILNIFAQDYDSHDFHTGSQYVGWAWSMESGTGPEVDGRETRVVAGMLRTGESITIIRMRGDQLAETWGLDPEEQAEGGIYRALRLLCGLEGAQA